MSCAFLFLGFTDDFLLGTYTVSTSAGFFTVKKKSDFLARIGRIFGASTGLVWYDIG